MDPQPNGPEVNRGPGSNVDRCLPASDVLGRERRQESEDRCVTGRQIQLELGEVFLAADLSASTFDTTLGDGFHEPDD